MIERFKEEVRKETDPAAQRRERVWVTVLEARRRLDADPQMAIDFLNKHIMLLQRGGQKQDLAPLFVTLARAYHALDDYAAAERAYEDARRRLTPDDGLNARILVGLAQIRLSRGPAPDETGEEAMHLALHQFKTAVQDFPLEPALIDALIGQADVEARLGQHPQARTHFAMAVEALIKSAPAWDPRARRLAQAMTAHATYASETGDFERALELLTTLGPLYQPRLPADMMMRFAVVHEQIAQDSLAQAGGGGPSGGGSGGGEASGGGASGGEASGGGSRDAIRLGNQSAAIHFGKSAGYYEQFADAVTLSRDAEHGEALWQAAHNYDRAQLWDQAIAAYGKFVKTRTADDRRVEAQYLLARSFMATGDFASAVDHFKGLISDQPNGRWAHRSLVPLARAYAQSDQLTQARATLTRATSDHPAITPDSAAYREALIELGKLHYRAGQEDPSSYVKAIETLTECVQRFGDDGGGQGPELRYLLADSHRLSIRLVDEKLAQHRAQRELIALGAERLRRLEEAQIYFNQVITELEGRASAQLSPLERTYLRNSYFYQADCAYDRGRFAQAIDLYDEAAKRWEQHPASLVAYVQIVNAHCELGQYAEARKANETALWQLERLPDEAFDDPTLPMTRQHWEDWLRWTSELDVFGRQASAS